MTNRELMIASLKDELDDWAAMDKRFSEAQEVGILGAYSKGYADACGMIVDDMGRWVD